MKRQSAPPFGHFLKPSALRHAMRIDRDSSHAHRRKWRGSPDLWGDDGRFTIPNIKEKRR